MKLYDYVYADVDKIVSLYSQLTGGIVEVVEISDEANTHQVSRRKYDFKVFRHEASDSTSDRQTRKETVKPHHSLFQELERALVDKGHLFEIGSQIKGPGSELLQETTRNKIKRSLCLRCTGRIVIEDYERIKHIANSFPKVIQLINKSKEANLRETAEFKTLEAQLELGTTKISPQERKKKEALLQKTIEAELLSVPPKWILDGVQQWIDVFLPEVINIRIYPYADRPGEHILGHLDKPNFTFRDNYSFHFAYGSLPSEEFTVLGIVTSVPLQASEGFDPLGEFKKDIVQDFEAFESALRGLFRGFDGLEAMVRTVRYPRVMVLPLLVYREAASA